MKKSNIILSALVLASGCFVGCTDDAENFGGDGRLFLNTTVSSDIKVVSRASADELNENVIIFISGEKGLLHKFKGLNQYPVEGVALAGGSYVVEAWAGDSVSASWDARYYKGREAFAITGADVNINLQCKVANVLAQVKYGSNIGEALKDYTMTVSHSRGSLTFEGRDERIGSFMMPSTSTGLHWKLEGKDLSGKPYVKEGDIENVQPAHLYNLNIGYTPAESDNGGGYLTVEIDETEILINTVVTIVAPPKIQGYGFDITKPVTAEPGEVGKKSVYVSAAAELTSVIIEYDDLNTLLGLGDPTATDIDLLRMDENLKPMLQEKGLVFTHEYDAENDASTMKISFEERLTNTLVDGVHNFTIKASIMDGETEKTSSAVLTLNLSGDPVTTIQVDPTDVWATHTILTGRINKPETTGVALRYREAGSTEWTSAEIAVSGNEVTAELTGLKPATRYEYSVISDGFEPQTSFYFTTESALQLPNSSFELWFEDSSEKNVVIPAENAGSIYWDSGNHGSITMGKNITVNSDEYKHSGNYSAKLSSQFVGIGTIGRFAAGNIFTGRYLATDGMDGILGWGRPFNSRPKALKGYVKYIPATVNYESSDVSAIKKGDMDQGIIYVALLDNSLTNANSSKIDASLPKDWPVIVKTKKADRTLFNSNDKNVIAYGEMVFTSATAGDMIEIRIPLDYVTTTKIPANVMVVCSASKYGDYFVGGPSVMYIDDLEFEY
ncbi:MAG: PCMD domain-containing protein [Muribaculaceae bacterium]|nr:PCMD domain-containing protein [Muribaculaceae bacterium]